MKHLVTLLLISFLAAAVQAQQTGTEETGPVNVVYGSISFGGLIGGISVNYERKVADFTMGSINLRGGLGRLSGWDLRGNGVTVNWAYLFGRDRHHIEINMGVLGVQDRYNDPELTATEKFFAQWDFFPLLNAGYRLQKPEGGFMLRTGGGMELFYIGIGYSF
ncbi:MAG: hypothetical protein RBS37_12550 [Bacteroidales bacterium]|jgi:hypothetical protein|nr:hypothetical protein [Bacteroidales bacterium]